MTQVRFNFGGKQDIARWHRRLLPALRFIDPLPRRTPIGQLVKSMISGRTQDAVSLAAYDRLVEVFGSPARVAAAEPEQVLAEIRAVTFAEDKAVHVVGALRQVARSRRDFDLGFLASLPLDAALAWLERLPGVGRKVAASTLNASTLDRPVMIVDSHVVRVLRRLGFVAANADPRAASEAVTAAMPVWQGADFLHFHMLLKRLGQQLCRPGAPECGACPLARDCRFRTAH